MDDIRREYFAEVRRESQVIVSSSRQLIQHARATIAASKQLTGHAVTDVEDRSPPDQTRRAKAPAATDGDGEYTDSG